MLVSTKKILHVDFQQKICIFSFIFFSIDEDNDQQAFFDSEEMFQQLNYECVDGGSVTHSKADEDKVVIIL